MTQIPLMTHTMIKWDIFFSKIFHCSSKNLAVIIIHDPTFIYGYDIIKTAPLVHT